jgi:stalled ribosome rescue protein Dom34
MLSDQMSKELLDRVIDAASLPTGSNEPLVLEKTLEALEKHQAQTEREKVEDAIGAWRAGGLGVAGIEEVRKALEVGQVDELLIAGAAQLDAAVAGELVTKGRQTSATVTVVEDASLLAHVGGVAALLRYRVPGLNGRSEAHVAASAAAHEG